MTSIASVTLEGSGPAAKDAGVAPAGGGSHRITIGGDGGAFADPDGCSWG